MDDLCLYSPRQVTRERSVDCSRHTVGEEETSKQDGGALGLGHGVQLHMKTWSVLLKWATSIAECRLLVAYRG